MTQLRNIPLYIFYNNGSSSHPYKLTIKKAYFSQTFATLDEAVFFRNTLLDLYNQPRPDFYAARDTYPLPEQYQTVVRLRPTFISTPMEPLNTNKASRGFDPQLLLLVDLSK